MSAADAIRSFLRSAAAAIARAARFAGRKFWRGCAVLARAIGKFMLTVWRLAGALDSALWRAVKHLSARLAGGLAYSFRLLAGALRSLLLWLPTRTGRAYSAVCAVVLMIGGLWIIDHLRLGPASLAAADGSARPPLDEADPILARIGARYVHLSEIEAAARSSGLLSETATLTPALAFERGLVAAYVEQRLLARAAQNGGLDREPAIRRRIAAARDRILASSFLDAKIGEAVTAETVRRYYEAQRDLTRIGDEVRARHILVETGEEAAEIVALLEGGADFGALARERSQDRATAPLGGEMGWFTRAMMTRPFAEAAFNTAVGDIAAPFQTEFGWHILQVENRRQTQERSFDAVSQAIEEYLTMRTVDDALRLLEAENQVVYYRPERIDADAEDGDPGLFDALDRLRPGEPDYSRQANKSMN